MARKKKTAAKTSGGWGPRRADLLSYLREPIVTGKLRAGDRLPPQMEIVKKFGSSPLTVKRAFRQLVDHGFARAVPKMGTFVADHPPHLCRYGIAFVHKRGDAATLFQDAIAAAAEEISLRDPTRQFSFYYEIDGHTDREGYHALMADLRARRLAGLIFSQHIDELRGSPVLADDGVPRIAITGDDLLAAEGIQNHFVDLDAFQDRAFKLALEMGCRRAAMLKWIYILPQSRWQGQIDGLMSSAAAVGLGLARRHIQVPGLKNLGSIHQCVHGLLDDAPERRPDVLIISDDNFVEEATKAIVQTGVRVPRELKVIAHCNYPAIPPVAVPVVRLGFDLRVLLEQCVEALDRRRNGQDPRPVAYLPPLLEEELVYHERSLERV